MIQGAGVVVRGQVSTVHQVNFFWTKWHFCQMCYKFYPASSFVLACLSNSVWTLRIRPEAFLHSSSFFPSKENPGPFVHPLHYPAKGRTTSSLQNVHPIPSLWYVCPHLWLILYVHVNDISDKHSFVINLYQTTQEWWRGDPCCQKSEFRLQQ